VLSSELTHWLEKTNPMTQLAIIPTKVIRYISMLVNLQQPSFSSSFFLQQQQGLQQQIKKPIQANFK